MFDYKTLYFDAVNLDISKALTSVGVTIKVGSTIIKWAHDCGDFGGTPSGLDCTPLASLVHMEKSGVVEQEQWEVSYYLNEDDYDALEALKGASTTSTIEVSFPNGMKLTNSGTLSANFATGLQVNGMADAKAVFNLSNANGWVKTSAT